MAGGGTGHYVDPEGIYLRYLPPGVDMKLVAAFGPIVADMLAYLATN